MGEHLDPVARVGDRVVLQPGVVLGGDEVLMDTMMVSHQFTDIYGIKPDSHIRSMCDYIGTLRESNDCMVFCSFNTVKGSQALWTGGYGGRYVT